jgi:hypothetical protein
MLDEIKYGLIFLSPICNMISNMIWNEISKLDFLINNVYIPNKDKIYSVVMDYLERTKND